jgi:glycosyltransferase involved in cell wall biosynthesis
MAGTDRSEGCINLNAGIADRPAARVAVITRTKNRDLLLKRAVESVLGQTYADWHHVIVNDGGASDPIDQLLVEFESRYQGRLTVIHNEQSLGMEAASNLGIAKSASEFVVIHDDDDSWEACFLQRCVEELQKCSFQSVKGVVTHSTQIVEKIEDNRVTELRRQDLTPELAAISIPQISELNRFMPIAFLFERSVLEDVGMFDETLPVIGDWEFNIRFFMKYDVIVIRENLAFYHVRPESDDEFGNTVSILRDKHEFYRALIVNKHMRTDISEGKLTSGMLLGFGEYFHHISGDVSRIGRLLDKVKKLRFVNRLRNITGL